MSRHNFWAWPQLMLTMGGVSMLAVSLVGCATVPDVVPQSLIEARAAFGVAKKANADVQVPEDFQNARRTLDQAESACAAEQKINTVDELAFEAKSFAQIAEANARRRIAEQEYDRVQQAMITQQSLLTALSQKDAALKAAVNALQKTAADKSAAEERANSEAKKAEEEARKRAEAEAQLRAQKEREEEMLRRAKQIKDAQVRLEARGLVINLSGKVLFDTGSSKLQAGAKAQLDQVASVLKDFSEYRVRIEGHTDSTGELLANNMLSQARAESVLTYLNQQGVSLDSLKAVGMGPTRPVATNKTPAGRQLNRRVEIILEKNNQESPTGL